MLKRCGSAGARSKKALWIGVSGAGPSTATVPASARLGSAARAGRVVVYVTANGATSYEQYVAAWLKGPASYTCPTCVPAKGSTAAVR